MTRSLPLGCITLLTATLAAQDRSGFEISLREGKVIEGTGPRLDPGRLHLTARNGAQSLDLAEVLAVHGGAIQPSSLPVCSLAGGEVVRGLLSGGDPNGEWLELLSPVLGNRRIAVDRVERILFRPDLARPEDLRMPDGAREALFTKAAIGFDILTGDVHEFGSEGVRFQPLGEERPRWFRTEALVGYGLAGAVPPPTPGPVEVLTRVGDRIRVEITGWNQGQVRIRGEGGVETELREADLACATFIARDVIWLSALTPVKVDESRWDGPPLYPWRVDQSAVGTPLSSAGRVYGRGIGVHSRSRLGFRVPDGVEAFWTRVGIDDAALGLRPRADVDVRVLLDDAVVFEVRGLAAGSPARSTGLLRVKPGSLLELEVDFGKGRDLADRVDWLMPVFLPPPGRD